MDLRPPVCQQWQYVYLRTTDSQPNRGQRFYSPTRRCKYGTGPHWLTQLSKGGEVSGRGNARRQVPGSITCLGLRLPEPPPPPLPAALRPRVLPPPLPPASPPRLPPSLP